MDNTPPWWDATNTGAALVGAINQRANRLWTGQQSTALRDRILESV